MQETVVLSIKAEKKEKKKKAALPENL